MSTPITAVIFDFGGVLIEWDPRNLYRRYFDDPETMEQFLEEVDFMGWNLLQDKGRPFAEGVAELSAKFPHREELIRAYHEHWEDSIGEPIRPVIEILKRVKAAGWPVYGLSNWSMETFPIARQRHHFFDLLDDYLLSGEVRLVKPDPAIFEHMLDKIGRKPEECIFIDDNPANVQASRALGIVTIHYQSPEQLEQELQHLGIL
jgi:2-haloacid dehalogenase